MKTDRNTASWGTERRAEIDARAAVDKARADYLLDQARAQSNIPKLRRQAESARIVAACLAVLAIIVAIVALWPQATGPLA